MMTIENNSASDPYCDWTLFCRLEEQRPPLPYVLMRGPKLELAPVEGDDIQRLKAIFYDCPNMLARLACLEDPNQEPAFDWDSFARLGVWERKPTPPLNLIGYIEIIPFFSEAHLLFAFAPMSDQTAKQAVKAAVYGAIKLTQKMPQVWEGELQKVSGLAASDGPLDRTILEGMGLKPSSDYPLNIHPNQGFVYYAAPVEQLILNP